MICRPGSASPGSDIWHACASRKRVLQHGLKIYATSGFVEELSNLMSTGMPTPLQMRELMACYDTEVVGVRMG
jgi:hypothetical protein